MQFRTEERKSYDAYAGEEEEEQKEKTCWTKEAEKMGKNNECFKVLQSCVEQKLGNFPPISLSLKAVFISEADQEKYHR